MNIRSLHSWDLTPSEAIALQKKLADEIDVTRSLENCEWIAGADCSYNLRSPRHYAAVVVLSTRTWEVVEVQGAVGEAAFPYVPGLLSFREAPIVLRAFENLEHRPDAVMLDGQGRAHPRRFGLACHLGLWLGIPCFGCAKTRLIGTYEEPGPGAGDGTPLLDKGEVVGQVLRTKKKTKPVYVSPGHGIDLESSIRLTLQSCRGYRIPEPTRQAHLEVNRMRLRDTVTGD